MYVFEQNLHISSQITPPDWCRSWHGWIYNQGQTVCVINSQFLTWYLSHIFTLGTVPGVMLGTKVFGLAQLTLLTFTRGVFAECVNIHWWEACIQLHWASKETYHFFKATLTKIHRIKINHIWTQISYYSSPHEAHLKNQRVAFVKKREKCGEIAKGHFSKITETARWEPPR